MKDISVAVSIPARDAYFLMLYLKDVFHCDIGADGRRSEIRCYPSGSICLVDLAEGAAIALHSSLDAVAFVIPKMLFDELKTISPADTSSDLECRRGAPDPVMGNLGVALLPLLDNVDVPHPASLPHIAIAVCAHLLHTYAAASVDKGADGGALSDRQEKAAKQFMRDHLQDDISVASIAAAAGLAADAFSLEFERVTGFAPQQWLTRLRVGLAKELLSTRLLALQDIADHCGFADQSHFTIAFCGETGMTPAIWRDSWLH